MIKLNFQNRQKGVSLYLALLVMAILLSIGLMTSTILLGQIKMIGKMGDSVIAFYAADTGIEKILINRTDPINNNSCPQATPCFLDNGASYYIEAVATGGECEAVNFCIKSVGAYRGIKRAIEVEY